MSDWIEQLWQDLPSGIEPVAFARRRDWLVARMTPGERVLDVGCGEGWFSHALMQHGCEVVGIDVAPTALMRAELRAPGLQTLPMPPDGPLPVGDGTASAVWAGEVLEHVADTIGWLSAVRTALAPRGRLLVSTPDHRMRRRLSLALRGWEEEFDPRGDHLRFYTRKSLRETLTSTGFEVESIERLGPSLMAVARKR